MNPYESYSLIWAPPYYRSLFVVKVPETEQSLDRKTYKAFMVQRLDWMIQRWMEEVGSSLLDTQRLLATTLSELHPSQEYPLINQEDLDLPTWRTEWAEAFILHNHRFSEALRLMGMGETDFPVTPLNPTHPEFEELLTVHQETYLEEWLTFLPPSSWD